MNSVFACFIVCISAFLLRCYRNFSPNKVNYDNQRVVRARTLRSDSTRRLIVQLERSVSARAPEPCDVVATVVDVVAWLVQWLNTFTHVIRRRQHPSILQRTAHAYTRNSLMPNTHRRRRRDSIVELIRVGGG